MLIYTSVNCAFSPNPALSRTRLSELQQPAKASGDDPAAMRTLPD